MARSIVLANGELQIALDNFGEVADLYFPYVGLENHLSGYSLKHRIAVWVDGRVSWLDDGSWKTHIQYHDNAMVSHTMTYNESLGVKLEFDDCVDNSQAAFLRNIHVINHHAQKRSIRLYMHQAFDIANSHMADTGVYLPEEHALLHYKGQRAFLVNASHAKGGKFDDFTLGSYSQKSHSTIEQISKGELTQNAVAHGKSESVLTLHFEINPHSSARAHYWLCAGKSIGEVSKMNQRIVSAGFLKQLHETASYWEKWLTPARKATKQFSHEHAKLVTDSLFILKSHIDLRGAVVSSADSSSLTEGRDTYNFCCPRDASYVLWPMLRLGFNDELIRFFGFCKKVIHKDGYLAHAYQSDAALAPSRLPYASDKKAAGAPIQTDETASVLFLFGQYHRLHRDAKFLQEFYPSVIAPMANFLSNYTGKDQLPLASYDIWSRSRQTTTYTTAVTYASLIEASELAEAHDKKTDAVRWRTVAEDMKAAAHVLFNNKTDYFMRGTTDSTIDASSFYGAFIYGLFDLNSSELTRSYTTLRKQLKSEKSEDAFFRFEGDDFHRIGDKDESNPWPIVSLWLAQYALEVNDRKFANSVLTWTHSLTNGANSLPEQIDPHDHMPASVMPHVWTQAELVNTLLDYISEPEDHA